MFIGHFAAGLGAKKFMPAVSLGILFIAAQFLDLLWPVLLLTGAEQVEISPGITKATPLDFIHYPITHSLLMAVVWGCVMGGIYWLIKKNLRQSILLAALVISHWFLDLIVHRPDLPLHPGDSVMLGFGLWNHPWITLMLEFAFLFLGVMLYTGATSPANKQGRYGLISLVFLLIIIQLANMFGPPPPDVKTIAWAGNLQWIFVILGFWVDKHRIAKSK